MSTKTVLVLVHKIHLFHYSAGLDSHLEATPKIGNICYQSLVRRTDLYWAKLPTSTSWNQDFMIAVVSIYSQPHAEERSLHYSVYDQSLASYIKLLNMIISS